MILTNRDIVDLTDFRHQLHQYPEVSGDEKNTAQKVAAYLDRIGGSTVITGLGGHGVAAVFNGREAGPTVMLRAELDGLLIEEVGNPPYKSKVSGKSHMCGHDGHSASLMGCALALSRQPPARGRVVLLFQPAEEDGSGAAAVIADPRFDQIKPDYAFSWHNMPEIPLGMAMMRDGPQFCASCGLCLRLKGRTAHASQPEHGLSPAQVLAALIQGIAELGTGGVVDEQYRLVTITYARLGEPTYGVAPGAAELRATLRALLPQQMQALCDQAEDLARALARQAGLEIELSWSDQFASSANDREATAIVRRALERCNVPHAPLDEPFRGSEDFGRFGGSAKIAMFLLGAGEGTSMLHNPDYDFPDALIPIGASVLLSAARELVG